MPQTHTISPDLPTPKYFCQYSKQPVSAFSEFLTTFFADAPPINQDKRVSKDTFSVIHLVKRVCELPFSIIQTHCRTGTLWHSDAFILFTSTQVVLDKDGRTLSPKATHRFVQHLLMPTFYFLNGWCLIGTCFLAFFLFLVLCSHLSLTVNSNSPHLKMTNFHKALNAKSLFIGLTNFFDQSGLAVHFSPVNGLNMQMSTNENSTNTKRWSLLVTKPYLFTSRFPYFLETFIFWEIMPYSCTADRIPY